MNADGERILRVIRCLPWLLCILASGLAGNSFADTLPSEPGKALRIVTDTWPPYVIGQPEQAGVDVEVALTVLRSLGYDPSIDYLPWKRALLLTENGEAHALLDAGYNEKRSEIFNYPEEPINYSVSTLFCIDCDRRMSVDAESLRGHRIAVNRGYAYAGIIDEDEAIATIQVDSFEQGMRLLAHGRVDFYAVNRFVGLHTLHTLEMPRIQAIEQNLDTPKPVYLVFSKALPTEALSQNFSDGLREFKSSSAYRDILEKYGISHD